MGAVKPGIDPVGQMDGLDGRRIIPCLVHLRRLDSSNWKGAGTTQGSALALLETLLLRSLQAQCPVKQLLH